MFRRLLVVVLLFLLSACNLSVPAPTPTLAPTRTPSPTVPATNTPNPTIVAQQLPSSTPTATLTPTNTVTPTATYTPTTTNTATATNTNEPTATSTATLTPSLTATLTPTATASRTDQPTATRTLSPTPTATQTTAPTATESPTVTPLPLIPTNTPTASLTPTLTNTPTATFTNQPSATPTNTITPSYTPSITPLPTSTPTRTLSPEELALFNTPAPSLPTLVPTLDLFTPPPPPTLDVTPTFITAEATIPDEGIITVTPIPFDTTPQPLPSFTPTIQPTVALIVSLAPTLEGFPTLPPFEVGNPQTSAFALSTNGGIVGTTFSLLNDTVLFERNPVDPSIYVTTDSTGNMYLTGVNGSGAYRPDMSPFSQFIPLTREDNNAFVPTAKWSPNGQYLAFIVAGRKLANDGVWFFQPGSTPPTQLLVDCPSTNFPGCGIVSNPFDPNLWESQELRWAPTSDAILVRVTLPEESRSGLIVLPLNQSYNTRPGVFRYEFGSWALDGSRLLVSGRSPDQHVYVGWLNRDGSFSELVYDSEANGLWMGFANQAQNGQIFALGAPGDRGGPREALRIYNMAGQPITQPIGTLFPERVEWSPDGSAVFVQSEGRQYIANLNGDIREITGQVSGTRAINWVIGDLPPSSGGAVPSPAIPSGVVAGNEYQPGQQLRVYSTELNIRTAPRLDSEYARNFLQTGEYVAILAGPVDADGIRWWQVQTADGVVGWVAATINGVSTLGI